MISWCPPRCGVESSSSGGRWVLDNCEISFESAKTTKNVRRRHGDGHASMKMHTRIGNCCSRKQYLVYRCPFFLIVLLSPLLFQLVPDVGFYIFFIVVTWFDMGSWEKFGQHRLPKNRVWGTYLRREIFRNPGSIQDLYLLEGLYFDGSWMKYGHWKRGIFSWCCSGMGYVTFSCITCHQGTYLQLLFNSGAELYMYKLSIYMRYVYNKSRLGGIMD